MILFGLSDLSGDAAVLAFDVSAAAGIHARCRRICRRSRGWCFEVLGSAAAVGIGAEVGWVVELSIAGEGCRSRRSCVRRSSLVCWSIEARQVQWLLDLAWCRDQVPTMLLRPFLSVSSIVWSSFAQSRFQHISIAVLSSFPPVPTNLKSIWSWSKPAPPTVAALEGSPPAGSLELPFPFLWWCHRHPSAIPNESDLCFCISFLWPPDRIVAYANAKSWSSQLIDEFRFEAACFGAEMEQEAASASGAGRIGRCGGGFAASCNACGSRQSTSSMVVNSRRNLQLGKASRHVFRILWIL